MSDVSDLTPGMPKKRRFLRPLLHFAVSFALSLALGYLVDSLLKSKEEKDEGREKNPISENIYVTPLREIQGRAYATLLSITPWRFLGLYFHQVFNPGKRPKAMDPQVKAVLQLGDQSRESLESALSFWNRMEIDRLRREGKLEEAAALEAAEQQRQAEREQAKRDRANAAQAMQEDLKNRYGKDLNLSRDLPMFYRPFTAVVDVLVRTYFSNGWVGLLVGLVQCALGGGMIYLINFRLGEAHRLRKVDMGSLLFLVPLAVLLGTVAILPTWLVTVALVKAFGESVELIAVAAQSTMSLFSVLWLSVKAAEHLGEEVIMKRLSKLLGI